jgi:trimethylamine---corrinoid protein Co-methyltransferase
MSRMVLRVLSDAEIEKIHEKTLEVFEKVGIKITHDEALQKLKKAGANVDDTSGIVKFPAKMVEELLQLAPSVARATGINGKMLEIGGDNRYYSSLILDPIIVDYHNGPRHPVLEDVRRHTIIGESLDRVDSMMRMQYPVEGIPEPDCYYKTMEVFLSHTTKQIHAMPTSAENCREWMDLAAIIAEASGLDVDNTPLLSLSVAITSPLQIHGPNIEIMKMGIQRCYPLIPTVCPMAGTTAPYSLAGTVVIANVEALALLLLTQVYKPIVPENVQEAIRRHFSSKYESPEVANI